MERTKHKLCDIVVITLLCLLPLPSRKRKTPFKELPAEFVVGCLQHHEFRENERRNGMVTQLQSKLGPVTQTGHLNQPVIRCGLLLEKQVILNEAFPMSRQNFPENFTVNAQ